MKRAELTSMLIEAGLENPKKVVGDILDTVNAEKADLKEEAKKEVEKDYEGKYKDYDEIKKERDDLKNNRIDPEEFTKTKEELKAFKEEKAKNERIKVLTEVGVDKDFSDYVSTKITGETDEEFKKNAEKYLEENPKFKVGKTIKIDSNPGYKSTKGDDKNNLDSMWEEALAEREAK